MESNYKFESITVGTVVDTNDPQQMGRVRVLCAALHDRVEDELRNIPWASYATPFGGTVTYKPDADNPDINGPMTYGMWAIPKLGAQVLVMCVDGNPSHRIWIGCLYTPHTPHTMPHGRFSYSTDDAWEETGTPSGPFSTTETEVTPLYTNYLQAFGTDRETNAEWRTRGADYSVAAVDNNNLDDSVSFAPDDKDINFEDVKYRTGYARSRIAPNLDFEETGKHYDSQTYSIVTPGFHAFSMDDRKENCRVRLRTTAGNQIILDDTNERIFISTANGKSWIEMDQAGNIDIHSDGKISMHSTKDMNFTTDKSFRVKAKEGIHLQSDTDVRIQSETDVNIRSTGNVRLHADVNTHISSTADIYVLGANIHNKASGGVLNIQASSSVNILAGGDIIQTGSAIHMNGPAASAATQAAPVDNLYAYATNRVPFNLKPESDEMWGRVCMDPALVATDATPNALIDFYDRENHEYKYDDENVGRIECGTFIPRGPYWRR